MCLCVCNIQSNSTCGCTDDSTGPGRVAKGCLERKGLLTLGIRDVCVSVCV